MSSHKEEETSDVIFVAVLFLLVFAFSLGNFSLNQTFIAYLSGFITAVGLGHFCTRLVVKSMWQYLKSSYPDQAERYLKTYDGQGEIVGIVERALFYGTLLAGQTLLLESGSL